MTNKPSGPDRPDHVVVPPKSNAGKLDYTYIVGGILLWGLIGWGLDFYCILLGLCSQRFP